MAEFIFASFLVIALFTTALHFMLHPIRVLGMSTSIFYMDEKITLAAYFTTVVSFMTGFLFLLHSGKAKEKLMRFLYTSLGLFFFALSLDEYFEIHEYANQLVKDHVAIDSIATMANFSWVFPLSFIIFAVFALFIAIFRYEKDRGIKLPILFGLISFALVIILEPIGGSTYGRDIYVLFVGLEEGLEMVGGTFFLLAALRKAISTKN